jgi:hypothetical protein
MSSDVYTTSTVKDYQIEFYQVTNGNNSSNFYRQYCTWSLSDVVYEGSPALHWIKTVFIKPLLNNETQASSDMSVTILTMSIDAYVDHNGNILSGEQSFGPGNMPVYSQVGLSGDQYLIEQDPILAGLRYNRELQYIGIENVTITTGTFECKKYLFSFNNGSSYYRYNYWIPTDSSVPIKLSLDIERPNDVQHHEGLVLNYALGIKTPAQVVAPIVAGVGIGLFGNIITRIMGFLFDGVKSLTQKSLSDMETKLLNIRPRREKSSVIFGISTMEIVIGAFAAIVLGMASLYTKIASGFMFLSIENILLFIAAAALTVILHELAHILVAYLFKTDTEMRFWGIGTLALIVTTLGLGFVFGQPMRTLINKEDTLGKRKVGLISLAGPIASFLTIILFILMMLQGGFLAELGIRGIPISIVLSVYSLLPFKPMEGRDIWKWKKSVWVITFIPFLILSLAILIFIIP